MTRVEIKAEARRVGGLTVRRGLLFVTLLGFRGPPGPGCEGCPNTCTGNTCDTWINLPGMEAYTCETFENDYGCDCSGCICWNSAPPPTSSPTTLSSPPISSPTADPSPLPSPAPTLLPTLSPTRSCEPGTILNTNASRGDRCLPCQAGTYASASGSTTCTTCSAGQIAPTNGSTSCTLCPGGKYLEDGLVSEPRRDEHDDLQDCGACDLGQVASEDRTSCTDCPPGREASRDGDR